MREPGTRLAERAHRINLFEEAAEIGGQFNMVKRIPGEEECFEPLRYPAVASNRPAWRCI